MKKHPFFPVFTPILGLLLFASCERDQPLPAGSGGETTTAVAPGDPEAQVGFRDPCDELENQCLVTVTATPGTATFDVCGLLSGGSGSCYLNTACGEVGAIMDSFTGTAEFCITETRLFYVRNTGTANISVVASSSGGNSGPVTIAPNAIAVFVVDVNCQVTQLC